MLFGRNAVAEALRGRRRHHRLIFAEGVRWDARLEAFRQSAEAARIPTESFPRQLLDDQAPGSRHQGVILLTSPYPYVDFGDLLLNGSPVLVLDHLQDPQNFGSLLRSAGAFGVSNVVIARDRSAAISPAVVNASAGAVEHLQIAQVTNLGRAVDDLKQQGYWIVGLDRSPTAQSLGSFDPPQAFVLVVGAEEHGLSASIAARCDLLVQIEQSGKIDSLNASVAGSIALYHLTRSRESPQLMTGENECISRRDMPN